MYIGNLPPASNRGTYTQDFQIFDDETDEGIDLTGATITLEIRKPGSKSPQITATNGGDARIVVTDGDEGQFELTIPVATMRSLDQMQYECGITIEQNDETTQYFIGTLPVLDGIVS
jgi:hypothetical protein